MLQYWEVIDSFLIIFSIGDLILEFLGCRVTDRALEGRLHYGNICIKGGVLRFLNRLLHACISFAGGNDNQEAALG